MNSDICLTQAMVKILAMDIPPSDINGYTWGNECKLVYRGDTRIYEAV